VIRGPQRGSVSVFHLLWLSVFALDASLVGRGWDHRLGAFLFLVFFAGLIIGEVRSHRDGGRGRFGDPDS
jgi:hypothetical protein